MNSTMTTNSQLSTNEPKEIKEEPKKRKENQRKQTTRTGTKSEKWTSHGGFSVGRGRRGIGEKRYREEA